MIAVLDWVVRAGFGTLMVTVVIYYLKERRKNLAESSVMERTVEASVVTADAGALGAHVLAIEHAFAVERKSKDREIAALDAQVTKCTEKIADLERQLAHKDETERELRYQVATLTTAVRRLEGKQP